MRKEKEKTLKFNNEEKIRCSHEIAMQIVRIK